MLIRFMKIIANMLYIKLIIFTLDCLVNDQCLIICTEINVGEPLPINQKLDRLNELLLLPEIVNRVLPWLAVLQMDIYPIYIVHRNVFVF